MRLAAIAMFVGLILACLPAASARESCGTPQQADDGWSIHPHSRMAGFDPVLLCEAVRTFLESPRNLHSLVVERCGRLVIDVYRTGPDRSTYSLWASRMRFDKDVPHDVRSVTKSVVAWLWGIAESERAMPPLTTPVLDPLPALADLRNGGRERITVGDGGLRVYVHLKLVPRAKLPFTTLRFRVRDRSLLAGLREGASVKFRAERIDGENTVVAIRAVAPCVRFQPCD